jgi:hypothetical protein
MWRKDLTLANLSKVDVLSQSVLFSPLLLHRIMSVVPFTRKLTKNGGFLLVVRRDVELWSYVLRNLRSGLANPLFVSLNVDTMWGGGHGPLPCLALFPKGSTTQVKVEGFNLLFKEKVNWLPESLR